MTTAVELVQFQSRSVIKILNHHQLEQEYDMIRKSEL